MGADIHMYVERKLPGVNPDYWRPFGGRINPGRDYDLFGVLAGVRREAEPLYAVRGLPEKMGYEADGDWWLYIVENSEKPDEHSVRKSDAEKYVASGCVYRDGMGGDRVWVSHPDWHTASWLTLPEFEKCVSTVPDTDAAYRALVAAMRSLESEGVETRVIFWFDN